MVPDSDGTNDGGSNDGASYCMEMDLPNGKGEIQKAWTWKLNSDPPLTIAHDAENPLRYSDPMGAGRVYALLFELNTSSSYPAAFHVYYRWDTQGNWRNMATDLTSPYREDAYRHPGCGAGGGGTTKTRALGRNVLFFDGHVGTFSKAECVARDWSR
jgi:prepilin-type processing-associated H-X9-DG protein